jgi:hypothetical protein
MKHEFIKYHENLRQLVAKIEQQNLQISSLKVSFMTICYISMVTAIAKDLQNKGAVNLQICVNCEMQVYFLLNVHVLVHSSICQRKIMCILISVHPVGLYVFILVIYTE